MFELETHKSRKLSRWMTPPTTIAPIASFHVHAVLHIVHSPCECTMCLPSVFLSLNTWVAHPPCIHLDVFLFCLYAIAF